MLIYELTSGLTSGLTSELTFRMTFRLTFGLAFGLANLVGVALGCWSESPLKNGITSGLIGVLIWVSEIALIQVGVTFTRSNDTSVQAFR